MAKRTQALQLYSPGTARAWSSPNGTKFDCRQGLGLTKCRGCGCSLRI